MKNQPSNAIYTKNCHLLLKVTEDAIHMVGKVQEHLHYYWFFTKGIIIIIIIIIIIVVDSSTQGMKSVRNKVHYVTICFVFI